MSEEDTKFSTEAWVNATPATYDVLDKRAELEPLIDALEAKCQELGIPYYLRITLAQDGTGANKSITAFDMGGPTKATPELIGMTLLEHFEAGDFMKFVELESLCRKKYNDESDKSGKLEA